MEMTPQEFEVLRKQANIPTQKEAAKIMGVGLRTYQRWASGTQKIPHLAINYLTLLIEYNKLKGG